MARPIKCMFCKYKKWCDNEDIQKEFDRLKNVAEDLRKQNAKLRAKNVALQDKVYELKNW